MTGKLGFGTYDPDWSDLDSVTWDLITSGATVCLLLGSGPLSKAADIKAARPDMLLVGRHWIPWENPEDDQYRILHGGRLGAEEWSKAYMSNWIDNAPAVDAWIMFNEAWTTEYDVLEMQCYAELAAAQICLQKSKSLVALNMYPSVYPTPNFITPKWPVFKALVRPLLSHPGVGYLGLHAYGAGDLSLMQSNAGMMLRYRELVDGLARDYRVPPVIFTEFGQGGRGWRSHPTLRDNPQMVIDDYLWFGDQIKNDPRVFGACNFAHGVASGGDWELYDTYQTEIFPAVRQWNGPTIPTPGCGDKWVQACDGWYKCNSLYLTVYGWGYAGSDTDVPAIVAYFNAHRQSEGACQGGGGGGGNGGGGGLLGSLPPWVVLAGAGLLGLMAAVALSSADGSEVVELPEGESVPPGYQVVGSE